MTLKLKFLFCFWGRISSLVFFYFFTWFFILCYMVKSIRPWPPLFPSPHTNMLRHSGRAFQVVGSQPVPRHWQILAPIPHAVPTRKTSAPDVLSSDLNTSLWVWASWLERRIWFSRITSISLNAKSWDLALRQVTKHLTPIIRTMRPTHAASPASKVFPHHVGLGQAGTWIAAFYVVDGRLVANSTILSLVSRAANAERLQENRTDSSSSRATTNLEGEIWT